MADRLALAVTEWSGQYFINESYRPIAEKLVKKYSELRYVPVNNILFIENAELNVKWSLKLK